MDSCLIRELVFARGIKQRNLFMHEINGGQPFELTRRRHDLPCGMKLYELSVKTMEVSSIIYRYRLAVSLYESRALTSNRHRRNLLFCLSIQLLL